MKVLFEHNNMTCLGGFLAFGASEMKGIRCSMEKVIANGLVSDSLWEIQGARFWRVGLYDQGSV